jgi:hypothetical protein
MQDVYLGVFMAMLPMLGAIEEINVADVFVLITWLILSFAFLTVLTGLLTKVRHGDEKIDTVATR